MKLKINNKIFIGRYINNNINLGYSFNLIIFLENDKIYFKEWEDLSKNSIYAKDYKKNIDYMKINESGTLIGCYPQLSMNEDCVNLCFDVCKADSLVSFNEDDYIDVEISQEELDKVHFQHKGFTTGVSAYTYKAERLELSDYEKQLYIDSKFIKGLLVEDCKMFTCPRCHRVTKYFENNNAIIECNKCNIKRYVDGDNLYIFD